MNISSKASNRLRLVLGIGLLLTSVAGCRGGPGATVAVIQSDMASVQKGPGVNPQISLTVDTNDNHAVVHVTFKNTSGADTCFFEPWQLFRDNMLEGSLLDISENGQRVPFLGALVKRRATEEKDLVRLPPGHSLQAQQDITAEYQFAPGTHAYTLVYAAFLQVGALGKYMTVRSQPATFTVTR